MQLTMEGRDGKQTIKSVKSFCFAGVHMIFSTTQNRTLAPVLCVMMSGAAQLLEIRTPLYD